MAIRIIKKTALEPGHNHDKLGPFVGCRCVKCNTLRAEREPGWKVTGNPWGATLEYEMHTYVGPKA